MTQFLFIANAILVAYLLLDGLRRRGGYLEIPFLSAVVYASWYLPQAAALLNYPLLPAPDLARVLLMSFLCLLGMWAGWRSSVRRVRAVGGPLAVPIERLIWPTLVITIFAAAMRAAIFAQPAEVRAMSQWSGPITIMAFFASVNVVSMVLSFAMVMQRRTTAAILLAGANLALVATQVLVYFRRTDTFELVFAILLGMYFVRRRTLPRVAVGVMLALSIFFVNGVGQLRTLGGGYVLNDKGQIEAKMPTLGELAQIDWQSAIDFTKHRSISETRNAAVYMAVAANSGFFSLGGEFYNLLVSTYVPGQLIGFELKRSLMIGRGLSVLALEDVGYETNTGSTSTGFVQPYRDFWFFGAFVFFFVAKLMSHFFSKARCGEFSAFAFYAVTLPFALLSITHYGYYYLTNAPFPAVVLLAALSYAKRRRRDATYTRISARAVGPTRS